MLGDRRTKAGAAPIRRGHLTHPHFDPCAFALISVVVPHSYTQSGLCFYLKSCGFSRSGTNSEATLTKRCRMNTNCFSHQEESSAGRRRLFFTELVIVCFCSPLLPVSSVYKRQTQLPGLKKREFQVSLKGNMRLFKMAVLVSKIVLNEFPLLPAVWSLFRIQTLV